MTISQSLRVLSSEVRWRLGKRTEERLRNILRDAPYWITGHLLLGEMALRALEHAHVKPAPRVAATLRVSALAALRLTGESDAKALRARYLLGAANFFDQDYPGAINEFRFVLAPAAADKVPVQYGLKALEYAGSAAMALNDPEQALKFFTAIPAAARSGEVQTAVPYLEALQRGEFTNE